MATNKRWFLINLLSHTRHAVVHPERCPANVLPATEADQNLN